MNNRKPFHSRFDYIVAGDGPPREVERRFEVMMTEAFDDKGRLRAEHRPTPKPQPPAKPESMFTIAAMLGSDGALRPHIA